MMITLAVELGALKEVPPDCWETHRRGKNWLATIELDPKAPGGLARHFFQKARGDWYYCIEGLEIGRAVEFGADYYSSSGRANRHRWYGVVLQVTPDAVILEQHATSRQAINAAKAMVTAEPANSGGRKLRLWETASVDSAGAVAG